MSPLSARNVSARIAANSFFQFWSVLLTLGSSLLLSIALARKLGPEQYGSYSFALWLVGLGALLSNMGISVASTKFISEYQGAGDQRGLLWVVRATLRSRALVAVAIAIALVPISMLLVRNDPGSSVRYYPLLISLALVPYALHQAFQGILKGFQRYDYSALALSVGLLLKAVIAITLVLLGYGILHLLALEVVTWVLAAGLGLLFLRRLAEKPFSKQDSSPSGEGKKNLVRYAVIATALLLMDFVINDRSELFFIKLYRPDAEVGYYSLAFAMAVYPVQLIPGALGSVLMPAISEQFGRGDSTRLAAIYVTSARYLMILGFPLAAGGIVMARPMVVALFGEEYLPMVLPTQILMAAAATYAVSLSTSSVIWGTNRPLFFLVLSIFMVPINLAACNLLIPLYGMKGAALAQWSTVASLPITVWYVSSRLGVSWPYKDTARIVLASALMAVGVTFLNRYLEGAGFIPVVILLGAGLYFVLLLMLRAVRRQDLELIGALWGGRRLPGWLARPLRLFFGVRPRGGEVLSASQTTADRPEIAEAGEPGAAG
jgi:O-antigen/teichoic acid export membrane protein